MRDKPTRPIYMVDEDGSNGLELEMYPPGQRQKAIRLLCDAGFHEVNRETYLYLKAQIHPTSPEGGAG